MGCTSRRQSGSGDCGISPNRDPISQASVVPTQAGRVNIKLASVITRSAMDAGSRWGLSMTQGGLSSSRTNASGIRAYVVEGRWGMAQQITSVAHFAVVEVQLGVLTPRQQGVRPGGSWSGRLARTQPAKSDRNNNAVLNYSAGPGSRASQVHTSTMELLGWL